MGEGIIEEWNKKMSKTGRLDNKLLTLGKKIQKGNSMTKAYRK